MVRVASSSPGHSALHTTVGKLFTHMCLCSLSSINCYQCKLGAKQAPRDTLVPCPWTCNIGWFLAEGYGKGNQCHPIGPCGSEKTALSCQIGLIGWMAHWVT